MNLPTRQVRQKQAEFGINKERVTIMSQIIHHVGVATVNESLNFQREFAPILSSIMNSAPIEITAAVKECSDMHYAASEVLLSPNKLKVIQTDFDKHLQQARNQVAEHSEQLKIAAIATLVDHQENLLVSKPQLIAESIQNIVAAENETEVYQEVKLAFHEIKLQHTEAFIANITHAVEESAAAVGFKEVQVQMPSDQLVRVVTTNTSGQNLITEIANEKQVDIRTELIGFTDGSCDRVMRMFDDEMVSRGISTEYKEQKPTYGVPQIPYAQKLLKPSSNMHRSFEDEVVAGEDINDTITIKY